MFHKNTHKQSKVEILFSTKIIILLVLIATAVQAEFVHPGNPFSITDLERMKANRTISPMSDGYDVINTQQGALDYEMQGPFEMVSNNPNVNHAEYISDSKAVLYQALQWYFTGNSAYAEKAIKILEAWSTTHTTWEGTSVHLHAAWRGGNFIAGAEILRYTYPGWADSNTVHSEAYFKDIIWPQFNFPLRAANQGANNLMGAMYVATYLSDSSMFNQVVEAYLNDPCGGISNTLPNGQNGDFGRDQGHSMAMIGNLSQVAEIAWKQGVDLFGTLDNRLLTIYEYWAKYNLGEDVPWIDHGTCYGYYTSIGESGREVGSVHASPVTEVIYGAYAVRKASSTPYATAYRESIDPNDDGKVAMFMYRKDGGDATTASLGYEPYIDFYNKEATSLTSLQIGNGNVSGSSEYDAGIWTIKGSGAAIGGRSDGFQYAYQELDSDGSIIAKLESLDAGLACLALKTELDDWSELARVCLTAGNDGAIFSEIGKVSADGDGSQTFPLVENPAWMKIERRGDNVRAYVGPDGESWAPIQNVFFDLPANYYVGLAVTSEDVDQLNTAVFSNVYVNSAKNDSIVLDSLNNIIVSNQINNQNERQSKIELYFNSFNQQLEVQIPVGIENSIYTIFNVTGHKMGASSVTGNSFRVDLRGFESGVYMIQVNSDVRMFVKR